MSETLPAPKSICPTCQADVETGALNCARCGTPLANADGSDPLVGKIIDGKFRVIERIADGGT